MKYIAILHNPIQPYAWGSLHAIPDLLGQPSPVSEPQAELWMGAHPKAPSMVVLEHQEISLQQVIAENPEDVLGTSISNRFDRQIPYLFKVLAAVQPLSIQAHPDKKQAVAGFLRESKAGIPLDAPERNYRDANHKPEIICALTKFWGLNGFRKIPEIIAHIENCCPDALKRELSILRDKTIKDRLKTFFGALMALDVARCQEVIQQSLTRAQKRIGEAEEYQWVVLLQKSYPSDIGVLSPLFLNLVCLEPGQAMFLEAGELHAYLNGMGIELMANSDNVLRGGLTPKHVDLNELMRVLSFREKSIDLLVPRKIREYELGYDTPAEEFMLSVIYPPPGRKYISPEKRSIEILLCTDGEAIITEKGNSVGFPLRKGSSVVIPAAVGRYEIKGKATLYKAAVPLSK